MNRLAILHYHLRPGGVTTVIRNVQEALGDRVDVQLLVDFGYDERPAKNRSAFIRQSRDLCQELTTATRGVDVLHTHNVNLGKHPRLTCAVKMLAERSRIRVINQVHDFAEDDRPAQLRALRYCTGRLDEAFYRSICYYDLPSVLWTTLTTHDAEKLATRGVPRKKIHVLPNPVNDRQFQERPPQSELDAALRKIGSFARRHHLEFDPRRKTLLSPMKVMERKNNAEAIELIRRLNALGGRKYQLLISMDGSSLRDRVYSDRLKLEVRRERLPVIIGVGDEVAPIVQFHLAHAILTTSKEEGFGYAFVEGWLCGKLVLGRDISRVTRDLAAEGLDLRHLYREFDQRAILRASRLLARAPRTLIAHNRKVVQAKYSLAAYANRFQQLLGGFLGR